MQMYTLLDTVKLPPKATYSRVLLFWDTILSSLEEV